ncbi:DUF397 domain-containing protein [Streptomyces sp. Midd1]|uniref:DUF397 domain-containing protein n=1 Tax=Streptomyces sp. Midd3 TaxID=3161191 RepID=UPI0034DAD05B
MSDKAPLAKQLVPETAWQKSSYSGGGSGSDCVEVAPLHGGRAIRDSKNVQAGELRLTEAHMAAFLAGVKNAKLSY